MKPIVIIIVMMLVFSVVSFGQNHIYDSLITALKKLDFDDQSPRSQLDSIVTHYGRDTSAAAVHLKPLWVVMRKNDSSNLKKVTEIIDTYGWLGPTQIGDDGSSTLFAVVQHADLKTQEKYLPIMREAAKKGDAVSSKLAYLEDRVALREGNMQIYGTQVFLNRQTGRCYVLPLKDPGNVDKRRANMGLQPISIYLSENFNSQWDLQKYLEYFPYVDSVLKKNRF